MSSVRSLINSCCMFNCLTTLRHQFVSSWRNIEHPRCRERPKTEDKMNEFSPKLFNTYISNISACVVVILCILILLLTDSYFDSSSIKNQKPTGRLSTLREFFCCFLLLIISYVYVHTPGFVQNLQSEDS